MYDERLVACEVFAQLRDREWIDQRGEPRNQHVRTSHGSSSDEKQRLEEFRSSASCCWRRRSRRVRRTMVRGVAKSRYPVAQLRFPPTKHRPVISLTICADDTGTERCRRFEKYADATRGRSRSTGLSGSYSVAADPPRRIQRSRRPPAARRPMRPVRPCNSCRNGGGAGSRTRVRRCVRTDFYACRYVV